MWCAAAGDDGQHGVQIWISKTIKFVLADVMYVSTRIMSVAGHADVEKAPIIVVSAHAPIADAPPAVKEAFWASLQDTIAKMKKRHPTARTFLCIDGNARLGIPATVNVGGNEGVLETENGWFFRRLLEECNMAAINTFFDAGVTWKSTHGTYSRIDYVACDLDVLGCVAECKTKMGIDLSLRPSEDHYLVAARFKHLHFMDNGSATMNGARSCPINKHNLSCPLRRDVFEQAIWQWEPSIGCSIDSHEQELA